MYICNLLLCLHKQTRGAYNAQLVHTSKAREQKDKQKQPENVYIYIYIFSVSKFLFLLKNITMPKCLIILLKDCYFHEVETILALMNVFAYVKCVNDHINLIQIQPGVKAKLSLILFYSFLKQNIKSCNAIETMKTTRMIKTFY